MVENLSLTEIILQPCSNLFFIQPSPIRKQLNHKQRNEHQQNAHWKRNPCRLHKSCNDIGHKGYHRCGNCIGKLCGHMIYMITLPSSGRHNGSI